MIGCNIGSQYQPWSAGRYEFSGACLGLGHHGITHLHDVFQHLDFTPGIWVESGQGLRAFRASRSIKAS